MIYTTNGHVALGRSQSVVVELVSRRAGNGTPLSKRSEDGYNLL